MKPCVRCPWHILLRVLAQVRSFVALVFRISLPHAFEQQNSNSIQAVCRGVRECGFDAGICEAQKCSQQHNGARRYRILTKLETAHEERKKILLCTAQRVCSAVCLSSLCPSCVMRRSNKRLLQGTSGSSRLSTTTAPARSLWNLLGASTSAGLSHQGSTLSLARSSSGLITFCPLVSSVTL